MFFCIIPAEQAENNLGATDNGGIYYYTTYDSHRICAVDLQQEDLNRAELIRYPMIRSSDPFLQNHRRI